MSFLSQHFVKIGIVALLVVGVLIRDDLFPSEDRQDNAAAPVSENEVISVGSPEQASGNAASTLMPVTDDAQPLAERRAATYADALGWKNVVDELADQEPKALPAPTAEAGAVDAVSPSESAGPASAGADNLASTHVVTTEASAAFSEKRQRRSDDAQGWAKVVNLLADTEAPAGSGDDRKGETPTPGVETPSALPTSTSPTLESPTPDGPPKAAAETVASATGSALKWDISGDAAAAGAPKPFEPPPAQAPIAPVTSAPPSAVGLNDARRAFHEGKINAAVEIYRSLLESDPGNYAAAGELGNVFASKKQWQAATDSYALASEILFNDNNWSGAVAMLNLVAKFDPGRAMRMNQDYNRRMSARLNNVGGR